MSTYTVTIPDSEQPIAFRALRRITAPDGVERFEVTVSWPFSVTAPGGGTLAGGDVYGICLDLTIESAMAGAIDRLRLATETEVQRRAARREAESRPVARVDISSLQL